MASSPKAASRRGWPFRAGSMTVGITSLVFAGLVCCALISFRLHSTAQSMGDAQAQRPVQLSARLAPAGATVPHQQAAGGHGHAVEAPQQADFARAFGPGFALIPRPVYLVPLVPQWRPAGRTAEARGLTLWWHAGQARQEPRQLQAVVQEYGRLLNVTPQELGTLNALPAGGVAIVLEADIAAAYTACGTLLGYNTGDDQPQVGDLAAALRSEWHSALLWNGRLAVCSVDPAGAFRFLATLRQMLDSRLQHDSSDPQDMVRGSIGGSLFEVLPPFALEDWPQHSWRGLQLDCVRHFMPVPFIKRYLSAMAYYKANTFHWHLTDDQAWRLYIPSRPKLVQSNKWSPEFYSTEDVHEVVEFAAQHFITVLPTIETPGHSLAALSAYPEIACEGDHFEVPKTRVGTYTDIMCVGKKELESFARDVFADVVRLFPGPYIHVGGDETPTEKWERSEHVKAFVGMSGLRNLGPDVMEAWYCFLGQLFKGHERTMVMWDDHFATRQWKVSRKCPGAERDWIVQAWKLDPPVGSEDRESVSPSWPFRTVASPMKSAYLDYPVASIDYNRTLRWVPGGGAVLGGSANMWTEDSRPEDVGAKVYPRYLGLAERLWGAVGPGQQPAEVRRQLDASSHEAARRHCRAGAPLAQDLGFACGNFHRVIRGRSSTWLGARVSTNVDLYEPAYSAERAVDADEESYFWGIAPKRNDYFEVGWPISGRHRRLGKWFRRIVATTGSRDRPGDRLHAGELWVAQWQRTASGPRMYRPHWARVATFVEGVAVAEGPDLARAPTIGVKIVCSEYQTTWMALTEITAEETEPQPHPTEEDIWDAAGNSPPGKHSRPRSHVRHIKHNRTSQ